MKIQITNHFVKTILFLGLIFFGFLSALGEAEVSISININYTTFPGQSSYYIQVPITTTNNILTYYEVNSPHTNFQATYSASGGQTNSTFVNITQFTALISEVTNGNWTFITDVGSASQKTYYFHITASGFTSNNMPDFQISNPTPEQANVSPSVEFTWGGGPVDYSSLYVDVHNDDYSYYQGSGISSTLTSWTPGVSLSGDSTSFYFDVNYETSGNSFLTISTPTTTGSQTPAGWSAVSTLNLVETVHFTTGNNGAGTGHTLVAHFPFDNASQLGIDSSGNGNDYNTGGGQNGGGAQASTNAEVGGGAIDFFRNDSDSGSAGYQGWYPSTPSAILSALTGSFSVSVWVKTTANIGNQGDYAFNGAAVLAADVNGLANDTVPIALTGGQVAFNTGGNEDDTLNSHGLVNDGSYHHVVVTRNQLTGNKVIYIDGSQDSFGSGTTSLLSDPQTVVIGALTDAGNPTLGAASFYGGYDGLVDDLQIYSGVLSSSEVAYLYNNPGQTVTNLSSGDFNSALNTTNLSWTTSGDSSWFVESTNTYNGVPAAAESGVVTGSQASVLSTTVTGPGTLTFYWQNTSPGNNLDLEFDMDGNYQDDIGGYTSWYQDGPFTIPSGQHTLSWTAYADGDTATNQAGYLDLVSYVQTSAPVITVNPFNQTNFPGYPVGLIAAVASNSATINWQWYKAGVGAINYGTNAFFDPTNSGTASVAGSYYAVASDAAGSATTTTATITFDGGTVPPNWTRTFKSPFQAQDDSQVTQDFYYGCVVDTNGNLYTAAEFGGNTTVGSSNLDSGSGGDAAAVVKQTSTGTPIWAVGITNKGGGNSYATGVALAPSGGVYLSGTYIGTNWLGTNQLPASPNGGMFISRFDANGSNIWIKCFSTTNGTFTTYNTLVADASGNVTFLGLFSGGSLTMGTNNFTITGQESVLCQLDSTGAVRWAQLLPSEFGQYLAYSAGRLYISFNTSSFGNNFSNAIVGGMTNTINRNWALAALNNTNGQAYWIRGVGAPSGSSQGNPYSTGLQDDIPRIAASGADIFIVGAAYASSAEFGSITVNFNSLRGQYFARYDTNGNAQVATTFGSITTTPDCVVADGNGNLYVDGNFDTFSFFGEDMLAAPREALQYNGDFSQAFLAKFDHNGNPLWARMAVSGATVNFLGIALASDGVWASGFCRSTNVPGGFANTTFGTNTVVSDVQLLSGGEGGGVTALGHSAGMLAKITDAVQLGSLTLVNEGIAGGNYQFNFLSTYGHTNQVQYSTNLATHTWLLYTNVIGDGTLKTFLVPTNTPAQKLFRVSTQ